MTYKQLIELSDSIKNKFNVKYKCSSIDEFSSYFVDHDFILIITNDNNLQCVYNDYYGDIRAKYPRRNMELSNSSSIIINPKDKTNEEILSEIYASESFNKSFRTEKIKKIKQIIDV